MMEAFEKWNKKEYPLPLYYEQGPIGRAMLAQRKHAWRATLEWVLSIKTHGHPENLTDSVLDELERG